MYEYHSALYDSVITRLRGLTGVLDLAPGPGGSRMSDYDQTSQIYQPELEDDFPGWIRSTVIALYPGAQIPSHVDVPIRPNLTCWHIPLQINSGCWAFHDGHWQQLLLGRVYQMDPTKPHGAGNWGDTVRLHLIVDTA